MKNFIYIQNMLKILIYLQIETRNLPCIAISLLSICITKQSFPQSNFTYNLVNYSNQHTVG